MKKLTWNIKLIRALLLGCLLVPTILLGQEEEEETPAEKQSAKESQHSMSIGGLDANPSKSQRHIKVILPALLTTGKIDNKTFVRALKEIIPDEQQAVVFVEELKASGIVPAIVVKEVIEEINDIEVPPSPPSVSPPTSPPDDPAPPPTAKSYSYDADSDILTIPGKLQTLQGAGITETNLVGLGIDTMTSRTAPYLVEAYELGFFSGSEHATRFNEILGEAVRLASILVKSLEITDQFSVAGSENYFDKAKLEGILNSRNPYFYQLVKVLASNGAFGDKDDSKIQDAVGKLMGSLFPNGVSSNEVSDLLSKTLGEIVFQKLKGDLGGTVNLTEFTNSPLFDLKVEQVSGLVAQDITLGSTTGTSTIDLSTQLAPTSNSPKDSKDWRIFGVGAGKDVIVKGNVSFKNSNRHPQTGKVVKDHALAVGALDEIHFHSKTIESDWGLSTDFLEKHLDYSGATQTTVNDQTTFAGKTNRIKMDFEGANLYLGSISKMELVNVDLESGGNLAVASLDELHIVSSDPTNTPNTFTAGKNTNSSDRGDNIQLFANERIVADGLQFSGRVDSIHMDARTVDLKHVTFPNGSEVHLASDLGGVGANGTGNGKYPTFGIGQRQIGRVNFIDHVKYDTNLINSQNSFDALGKLPNGKQPITISKR
ncbi:MAG: hypothetical protein CMI26_10320 [Opitutae bacterium]|jgi:hypothetical protein|nr:hypothetical protein [Opitutae bacterium]